MCYRKAIQVISTSCYLLIYLITRWYKHVVVTSNIIGLSLPVGGLLVNKKLRVSGITPEIYTLRGETWLYI